MRQAAIYLAAILSLSATAHGQVVIADNYNVTQVAPNGFALGTGANSGINPPDSTRLTGTAADGLRYMNRAAKGDGSYFIGGDTRLRINSGLQSGRITLSSDGINPFDFGVALGVGTATAASPVEYDITISMDNNGNDTQRMSFALGTVEGANGVWDFGLQLHRAVTNDNFYTVSKRIDVGSSGLGADQNASILSMASGSVGTEVSFVIRVTDAGEETSAFNSRVRVSQDGGANWFYDTQADATLTNGFRLDGASRFFSWDIAPNSSFVTYDNFSVTMVTPVPEPGVYALAGLGGLGLIWLNKRRKGSRG